MFNFLKRGKRKLRKITVDHIAAVDRPAQEAARAVLMKRAGGARNVVHTHTEALAKRVAEICSEPSSSNRAEAMGQAFAGFETSFVDDISKRVHFRGEGVAHDKLRASFDDEHRGNPHLTPQANYATAWRSLSDAEREGIRREEIAGASAKAAEDKARAEAIERAHKSFSQEDSTNMSIVEKLTKAIVDGDTPPGISEADLTKIGFEHAQKFRKDGETKEAAFTQFYTDNLDFRKAIEITKHFLPVEATHRGNYQHDIVEKVDVTEAGARPAMETLKELAENLRERDPDLTREQAFSKVYTDPKYRALAARERRENRPAA